MDIYRLFIAAELPAQIKGALVAMQDRLRQGNPPVKWVAPQAMHLTLRFLGDTAIEQLPRLSAALKSALADRAAIRLRLNAAGVFPNERRPSVVWAGVGGAIAALAGAQADIEATVAGLDFVPEAKAFRAHLTLGRMHREARPEQHQQLSAVVRMLPAPEPLEWTVERIVLFRSELRNDGPIYTEIVDYRLQAVD
ncbi:MAG: RNA 2',3'-cyclic phosphodiesterase [Roseiflexaceae bacterium]